MIYGKCFANIVGVCNIVDVFVSVVSWGVCHTRHLSMTHVGVMMAIWCAGSEVSPSIQGAGGSGRLADSSKGPPSAPHGSRHRKKKKKRKPAAEGDP